MEVRSTIYMQLLSQVFDVAAVTVNHLSRREKIANVQMFGKEKESIHDNCNSLHYNYPYIYTAM